MTPTFTAPDELKELDQWVNWRKGYNPKQPDKPTKRPVSAHSGVVVDAHEPGNWATWEKALQRATMPNSDVNGVGFVLTEYDPFVGVDLDNCIDDAGNVRPWAADIVRKLGSYTEVTPSRHGLRIFVRGSLPSHGRKRGNIEVYSEKRFLTVTGAHLSGTPATIETRQAELTAFHRAIFGEACPVAQGTPQTAQPLTMDDEELLAVMFRSRQGYKIKELWEGSTRGFPSPSEAALALCSHLSYYTGGDVERIDRLFRQSGLHGPKWDRKDGVFGTWGARTIRRVTSQMTGFYNPTYRSVGG